MRCTLAAILGTTLLGACGDNIGPQPVPIVSGPARMTLVRDDTFVFQRDTTTLLTFTAADFQVGTVDDLDSGASFDPYWLFVDNKPPEPDGFAWHETTGFEVLASTPQAMTLALDTDAGRARLAIKAAAPGNFSFVLSAGGSDDAPVAYLRVRPTVDETEGFYGLGEWPDGVEHRGKLRPTQIEADTTLEGSNNENHVPVPLVIGTRGWGVFVKSRYPGVFDVARQSDDKVDIAFGTGASSAQGLEVHLFSAEQPLDVLRSYHEVTGFPGVPADWAYGPLLWRDETTNQAQVFDDILQIRTRDLATSGIWFDRPYATGVNTFDWNPAKFSAPTAMLGALRAAGLRYGIWNAPYVAAADNDQDQAPAQHDHAEQQGYFPPVPGIPLNQWGDPIDFTNPDAYAWWQSNLRVYTDTYGVEGFKLDYGEDIVLGIAGNRVPWKFADGSDERTMHYDYTLLYHRVYRELLSADGAFLLTRTGRWGDQVRGMIIWPGDLAADLSRVGDAIPGGGSTRSVGGLPTALSFGIGLSASGFPFYASDTGGYRRSPPNKETWVRWVEANAVWSAMQVGDSSAEMPWEFTTANGRDTEALDIYRRYARLHLRLFPYTWSYAARIAITGHPIVRPFGLVYPELNRHPADQYLFGESLFVAPVITPGATTRTFTLPPGTWLDWWTGDVLTGAGDKTVTADLGTLPLYIALGGIVPMLRDTIDTLAPATDGGVDSYANDNGMLVVRTAPGPDLTTFTLFDGSVLTAIDQSGIVLDTTQIVLTYEPSMIPRFSGLLFEVIRVTAEPALVLSGSMQMTERASYAALQAAADGWFWDSSATGGTLWIKVPSGAATITVQP